MTPYRAGSIEEKVQQLEALRARATETQRSEFDYRLDLSWIHHDSALEGIVYEPNELVAALEDRAATDTSLIPIYDEIRQFRDAIALVREMATRKRFDITLDTVKEIYLVLTPEEAEGKGPPKYRKDMPLHRVYFHEIAPPEKIPYKMRKLIEWLANAETKRTMHPTRIASRAHYTLLHIFPFPKHSGKVARLLMNMMLLREGYPPAILHATDRQRYYDALKTSRDAVAVLVNDALDNGLTSAIRYFNRELGIEEEEP